MFTYLSVGIVVGQTSSMTPDYNKAKIAAQKIFTLIDSVPSIDNQSDEGLKPVSKVLEIIHTMNFFSKLQSKSTFERCVKLANTRLHCSLLMFLHISNIFHQLTSLVSRIVLQVGRKIAWCNMAYMVALAVEHSSSFLVFIFTPTSSS